MADSARSHFASPSGPGIQTPREVAVISVSDMLKILDNVPIWKTVKALPARLEALEKRVATLEGRGGPAKTSPWDCTVCGSRMRVIGERSDPTFGVFGVKLLKLACDICPRETERQFDPNKDPPPHV